MNESVARPKCAPASFRTHPLPTRNVFTGEFGVKVKFFYLSDFGVNTQRFFRIKVPAMALMVPGSLKGNTQG